MTRSPLSRAVATAATTSSRCPVAGRLAGLARTTAGYAAFDSGAGTGMGPRALDLGGRLAAVERRLLKAADRRLPGSVDLQPPIRGAGALCASQYTHRFPRWATGGGLERRPHRPPGEAADLGLCHLQLWVRDSGLYPGPAMHGGMAWGSSTPNCRSRFNSIPRESFRGGHGPRPNRSHQEKRCRSSPRAPSPPGAPARRLCFRTYHVRRWDRSIYGPTRPTSSATTLPISTTPTWPSSCRPVQARPWSACWPCQLQPAPP
jgi:hypothetical protein